MFLACFAPILMGFVNASWHFLCIFWNKPIKKMPECQFLFSANFGFRKVIQEIFSELDDLKTEVPIFSVPKQLTWRDSKRGHRVATHGLGAAIPGPVPRVRVGPLAASDSASLPIYSPFRENPRHPSHIP